MGGYRQILQWGGILLFLLFCFSTFGQINLVLNPSFEQHVGCGGFDTCSLTYVNDWYEPTGGSADWMNACQPSHGVPVNFAGYQFARTGVSYAGVGMISGAGTAREYVRGQLSKSLDGGKRYCVSFYTSMADSAAYAISALGAYLSGSLVCFTSSDSVLPYIPQIENPLTNLLLDSLGWQVISGEYTASGGEAYITLGDFYSDSQSHFTHIREGGIIFGWNTGVVTYYYIDDVSVREIIQANAGGGKDTVTCAGTKILIGQDTAMPGISYSWQPVTGLSNPNAAQTFASPTVTTTYTLIAKNDSMQGCKCPDSISMDSITIRVKPLPVVSFKADISGGCSPVCVNFTDMSTLSSGTINSWLWNFGDGNNSSLQNPSHCFTNPGSYAISLSVTSDSGCSNSTSFPNMINVYSYPVANFTFSPQSASLPNPTIQFTDSSSDLYGVNSWQWNFGNGTYGTQQNPTDTYLDTGTFCVTLKVGNLHGCEDSITKCLIISPEALPCDIFVPTAFSPNKDGQNDVLLVRGNCVETFFMSIYDRWGNKVFETYNVNIGWDGTFKDKLEDAGTYVYYLSGTYSNGNTFNKKGNITLAR